MLSHPSLVHPPNLMREAGAETPTWHDGLLLGGAAMDQQHEALVATIDALRSASDNACVSALEVLASHVRGHFAAEEAWMTDTGFPARECHVAEHRAVLASIDGVRRRVAAGEVEAARRLATALADWFPAHADYLDAPLSHWLCRRRLGGQPVVLRRSRPPTPHPMPPGAPC